MHGRPSRLWALRAGPTSSVTLSTECAFSKSSKQGICRVANGLATQFFLFFDAENGRACAKWQADWLTVRKAERLC